MSIEIVHHQPHFGCLGVALVLHLIDLLRPVLSGATFANRDMSLARKWLNFHKNFNNSFSHILIPYLEFLKYVYYRVRY